MLTVRAEQIAVFEQAALRNFEDRMLAHLKQFAPNHSTILSADEMLVVIRHALKKAADHGFTSERSVRMYTELMLMLGSSFDTDPQLPWAAELINDRTLTDEVTRIDRLADRAWDYVGQISPDFGNAEENGPKSFFEQIRWIRAASNEELLSSALHEFHDRGLVALERTLPRKCELLGEQSLRQLIDSGIKLAARYGITTERGCVFFIAGMFMLGSGFDTDPQLPWVTNVLNDPSLVDQKERVNRLFAAAIDRLNRLRS